MFARRSIIFYGMAFFAITLAIASDLPTLKKKNGRKLSYSIANALSSVTIRLTAYSPDVGGRSKIYKTKVGSRKSKDLTATVFEVPEGDFRVEILHEDRSLLNQEFRLIQTPLNAPGQGTVGAFALCPPEEHLEFDVSPDGRIIWIVRYSP